MKLAIILAGLIIALSAGRLPAQELGDAKRGLSLAQTTCAECHAIGGEQFASPDKQAPSFKKLATTPGITPLAIRVALQTAHRDMPNLMIKDSEIDDLIAYIATLK